MKAASRLCTTGAPTPKPFHSIPGPKSLPIIGSMWTYFPIIGDCRLNRLHRNGFIRLSKFGPLVREEIVQGVHIVYVYTPDDIQTVYRCEGKYPMRRSHLALEKYRLDRPQIYNSGGLLPTNGSEWYRIRSTVQKDINRVRNVRLYLSKSDDIIKHFLDCRASCVDTDLLPELCRLYLELGSLVCFNKSLNCFSVEELRDDSCSTKMIKASAAINGGILKTDTGLPLWKIFDTPVYRKMCLAHEYVETVTKQFINDQLMKGELGNDSLLEIYLKNEELDMKDVTGISIDLLLAGIDTMSYSSCWSLYLISRHMHVQDKMFDEIKNLIPLNGSITEDALNNCPYTKAVTKEVQRMYPVSVGNGRTLAQDAILSGYHVPAGTMVVTQNQVSCRLPEYFDQPNEFNPDRWLKEEREKNSRTNNVHPYLVLPFGHGPRSCIARRLAEQNLLLLLINVVRNYKIKWAGGPLDCESVQINKPDGPVFINFQRRLS